MKVIITNFENSKTLNNANEIHGLKGLRCIWGGTRGVVHNECASVYRVSSVQLSNYTVNIYIFLNLSKCKFSFIIF